MISAIVVVVVMVVLMVLMAIVMPVIVAIVLADAADVVMMADLRLPDGLFEARQLHAILAQFAVHVRAAVDRLLGPLQEDLEQQRVGVEVIGTRGTPPPDAAPRTPWSGCRMRFSRTPVKRKNGKTTIRPKPIRWHRSSASGDERRGDADETGRRPAEAHALARGCAPAC